MMARALIESHDQVDSTMRLAELRASEGAVHGTTVIARSQTHGRGRRGREWFSPPGGGLWMTMILRSIAPAATGGAPAATGAPANDAWRRPGQLSLVAAIAVRRVLALWACEPPNLKWPNDILVGGRKLCGILATALGAKTGVTAAPPVVLVGIGVNLAARRDLVDLPANLDERYVGLADVSARVPERLELAGQIRESVLACCERWVVEGGFGGFTDEWNRHDRLKGRRVRASVGRRPVEGTALGVRDDGELQIRLDDGSRLAITAGEVDLIDDDGQTPTWMGGADL